MRFVSAYFLLFSNIFRSPETPMGINVWERINFNLRKDYLKKILQKISEKNESCENISSFIIRSDLNRSYCRIN